MNMDLHLPSGGHANLLYVDVVRRRIEIFEAHGVAAWSDAVTQSVKELFAPYAPGFEVVDPGRSCIVGPQIYMRPYDRGFCVAHVNLYSVLRVLNPDVDPTLLIDFMSRGTPQQTRMELDRMVAYVQRFLNTRGFGFLEEDAHLSPDGERNRRALRRRLM